MYCQNCGKEVTGNFCQNCGTAVASNIPTQSVQSAQSRNTPIVTTTENKSDKISKPIFIVSLVFSVLLFFRSAYTLFSVSLMNLQEDSAFILIGCGAPFALCVLIGAALRGKSKIAASIFYVLSILASLFMCCAGLAVSDDFLLIALLCIPFIILTWIFGNRCTTSKLSKAPLIIFAVLIVSVLAFILWYFSGEIALNRSASNLFEGMSEYSFSSEVETAKNLFE